MGNKKLLIIDDDKNICELLDLYLSNEGFSLVFAHDGSSALDLLKDNEIDLILLDVMLPVINGWEVCRMIRRTSSVPIIMLTARDIVEDKVQGFELGADDYVVKPFEPKELIVRIRARLKGDTTRGSIESGVLKVDNIIVNINKYEVISDGEVVDLKPKEIQLLYFLLNNRNIVFSRDHLLEKVWSYEFAGDTRTVDVHIKRLREKLEKPGTSWGIKTVWGVGYKLEVK